MINLLYPKFWQRRGLLSYLLLPFSAIYFLLSKLRYFLVTSERLNVKVICVGNISVGGTGKTQIVIMLAKWLTNLGVKFVIINKAYNSKLTTATIVADHHTAMEVGDESLILKNYGIVIAAKKIIHAKELLDTLTPEIIILDDGMQNPYAYKDCTILTVDGMRNFGNGFLLPAGPLRESKKAGEAKANIIVVVEGKEGVYESSLPMFYAHIKPLSPSFDKHQNYFAFCSIGNPEKFFNTVRSLNLNLCDYKVFPDHYHYHDKDLDFLTNKALSLNAVLITSEKDYVKVKDRLQVSCLRCEIIIENQTEFFNLILKQIRLY